MKFKKENTRLLSQPTTEVQRLMSLRSEEHSGVDTINNQEEDPRRVMKEQSRAGRRSSNLFKDDSPSGTTSFNDLLGSIRPT